MTFNILYGTLQKARKSSRILFHSSASTTSIPEELLKGSYELFHITDTSNGKYQTNIAERPKTAFSFKERHVHTSACKHVCNKVKEENDFDKNEGALIKNEQVSTQNNKLKINKSKYDLIKKRSFYKIRHQNLVWDGSNKRNRLNKYKMSIPISEKNKELAEKRLNKTHIMQCKKSESNLLKDNKKTEIEKFQDFSSKNLLAIDIFTDSNSSPISYSPHSRTILEDNINESSKINTTTISAIENSDKLIYLKEVDENSKNNWKIINNNSLINKSTIKDSKNANLTFSNQNKVPMNEIIQKMKYEPLMQTKNMDEDNYVSLQDHKINISDSKLTDNKTFKGTKNILEPINTEDSKSIYSNKPKSNIENKKNLDDRKNVDVNKGKKPVWDTVFRQNKSQSIPLDQQYSINLENKIKHYYKNIDLNHKHKCAHSVNSILRPVKSKPQIPNESYDYQLLPKDLITPVVPDLHEVSQNPNNYYSNLFVSKDNPKNMIKLQKDINSSYFNKKSSVTDLKSQIEAWKKYEHLKKGFLQSTSEIYRSIMNSRKIRKITKNTINTPRKKRKCSIISIPLIPNVDINKYRKITQTKMNRNNLQNKFSLSKKTDPIMIMNLKYKKPLNYQITYKELLKKNEILTYQEKFKNKTGLLDYNTKKGFQTEDKFKVLENNKEMLKGNTFKNLEEKNLKVFMKNEKKISLENKKPWVRYMHQMNDENKGESSKEISTYPSGCLKKPEFIIELLPFKDEHQEEMKKNTQLNISDLQPDEGSLKTITKRSLSTDSFTPFISDTFNMTNKKLGYNIIANLTNKLKLKKINKEYKDTKLSIAKYENGKEKPISFSDLCKMKSEIEYESKHTVNEMKHPVSEKINLKHKTHCPLCFSLLDQEHCLSYENFEEIEPKININKLNNDSIIEVEKVNEDSSKKPLKENVSRNFQTKRTVDNETLNEINNDCNSNDLNKNLSNNNKKIFILKSDKFPTNDIKVEVCSNIICEQPAQNTSTCKVLSQENKSAVFEKQHPKFIHSTIHTQENIPSQSYSFLQNQPGFVTTDISREIKSMPIKPISQQLHAIEISFNSSPKNSALIGAEISQETQEINCSTKATSFKPEFKSNLKENQHLNSCKNSDMNAYEKTNNFCINNQLCRDINLQHSNCDQNVSNPCNLGIVVSSSARTQTLGEEISNSSNNKDLAKQAHAPLLILSEEKKSENRNLPAGLETRKSSSESKLQTSQQNKSVEVTKNLLCFKQPNSYKSENMNADICKNGCNLFSFMKKNCSEISALKNDSKKALIDNIKGFFLTSYNYFKLENYESKVPIDNVLSNSPYHSKDKHNKNHNISESFGEINQTSKQPAYFPESNKQSYNSPECSKPDFHQKLISDNYEGNKIKLLTSHIPKHGKENSSLSGNEEFKKRFSKMLTVFSKGEFSTSKELEYWVPKEEVSINNLETGMNTKTTFPKHLLSKTDNSLDKNNHHSNFLNKGYDKDVETFSGNQVKQQRSFCNLNHKKSYMKYNSKNRLLNKKSKQKLANANVINIKRKLSGFHYSMNPKVSSGKIPNFVKRRRTRKSEMIPFKWTMGLKPVKSSVKFKKCNVHKLHSNDALKLGVTKKSNLLKTLQSFQKLSDKSNPESYWLNCFSKNIYTDDKPSCNEFLTYIKRRKLPRKLSFKSNK